MTKCDTGNQPADSLDPLRARVVLALFAGFVVACLAVDHDKAAIGSLPAPSTSPGDFDLYRRIVQRVRGGEGYYDVAHDELHSRGFPTRSVLNWRTPVYAWFLGRVTGPQWGRWLLTIGMVVAVVLSYRDFLDDFGALAATVGGVFLLGAGVWSLGGEAYLLMEFWAGMLITLSVSAFRRGWTAVGVGAGLLALFYRELALPYALVSASLACYHGRKRETTAWVAGLALFALFMLFHTQQVLARITSADLTLSGGWVRFGGLAFVLETARMNVLLLAFPSFVTALYLPIAVVGLAGGRGEPGWRVGLTAALYLAAFSVVGNPFNFYWGFLTAPLLAIGLAGAPRALKGLLATALPAYSSFDSPKSETALLLPLNARSPV